MKSKNLGQIILETNNEIRQQWIDYMENIFSDNFWLIYNTNIVGLFLLIFVKPNLLITHWVKIVHDELIRLGAFNLANKGSLYV